MLLTHYLRLPALWLVCGLGLRHGGIGSFAQTEAPPVTTVAQLRANVEQSATTAQRVRLEGEVWWANAAQGRLVLRDATATTALELELPGTFPTAGQRVRLEGTTTVTRRGYALRLGTRGPIVDNNGVHALVEKSGTVISRIGPTTNPLGVVQRRRRLRPRSGI
ncbi:MAG: hypothetical protein QM813_24770 [Verrucomicrobiota bacterium]